MVETQTNRRIKAMRSDNGTEFCNEKFTTLFKSSGIKHQKTVPHSPQQNGVAERMNRTLVEMAKCMLFDADLPKRFWAEAINMAAYIQNRILKANELIPYEVFFEKKVSFSNLKIFGTPVMVHVPKQKRKKWDRKSEEMIFIGYEDETKGYRCIDKRTGKVTISRDVIFNEDVKSAEVRVHPMPEVGDSMGAVESKVEAVVIEEQDSMEAESFIYSSPEPSSLSNDSDYEPDDTLGEIPTTSRITRS